MTATETAAAAVRRDGFLRDESGSGTLETSFARLMFTRSERMRVYRQIHKLHESEIPIGRALKTVWDRASDHGRKRTHPTAIVMDDWIRKYKRAASFAAAAGPWVPSGDRMILEAGEQGGDISGAIANVIHVNEASARMRSAVVGSLAYPIVLFLMLVVILWLFGTQVIPPFGQVVPVEEWTGIPATLAKLSELVRAWTVPFLGGVVVLIAVLLWTMPRWTGDLRRRLDRYPPWSIYRIFQGTGFIFSLVALLRAGVPLPRALSRMRRNANPWLLERIDATIKSVNAGRNLGEALFEAGYDFPDREMVEDLRVFAELGKIEETLSRIADEWMESSISNIKNAMRTINVVVLFLITVAICWLYYGLMQIYQMIQSQASA